MPMSRTKKTSFNVADTMREAALVKTLEATKAELAKALKSVATAKAETVAAKAKLEAVKRRPQGISRISGR